MRFSSNLKISTNINNILEFNKEILNNLILHYFTKQRLKHKTINTLAETCYNYQINLRLQNPKAVHKTGHRLQKNPRKVVALRWLLFSGRLTDSAALIRRRPTLFSLVAKLCSLLEFGLNVRSSCRLLTKM